MPCASRKIWKLASKLQRPRARIRDHRSHTQYLTCICVSYACNIVCFEAEVKRIIIKKKKQGKKVKNTWDTKAKIKGEVVSVLN
jgi:hypothetical protein